MYTHCRILNKTALTASANFAYVASEIEGRIIFVHLVLCVFIQTLISKGSNFFFFLYSCFSHIDLYRSKKDCNAREQYGYIRIVCFVYIYLHMYDVCCASLI